jgi:hypothetical protein
MSLDPGICTFTTLSSLLFSSLLFSLKRAEVININIYNSCRTETNLIVKYVNVTAKVNFPKVPITDSGGRNRF